MYINATFLVGSMLALTMPFNSLVQPTSTATVYGSNQKATPPSAEYRPAQFPGGPEALRAYLTSAKYPAGYKAPDKPTQVYVEFVVSPTGQVTKVMPVQPLSLNDQRRLHQRPEVPAAPAELLIAATELITAMPAWEPGIANGKPDFSIQRVPVVFGGTPESLPLVDTGELASLAPRAIEILGRSIRYPATAIRSKIQGVVLVYVEVSEQGQAENAQIVRSVSKEIDAEVLRVIQNSLLFQVPKYQNRSVRCCQILPCTFAIAN